MSPLPLKLPLLPFDFFKVGVNAAPFPFLPVLLEMFLPIEEVLRHNEFLEASFCKAIIDIYLAVYQLVIKSARSEPFLSPPMYMYTAALMSMDFSHHAYEVLKSRV